MTKQAEIQEKKRRLRALLPSLGLEAVYLKRQGNFAWLTAGGSNVVGISLELGVAGLLLTPEREYAICNNIEAPRMRKEEGLEGQGYALRDFPWYEDGEAALVRELAGKARLGADHAFPGAADISRQICPLRYPLTPAEVERYREVGRLTAQAIADTARAVRPGHSECAITGALAARLWENGLDYITIFCAADQRIADYRHPISTGRRVEQRAMLCVNARRYGLIVSLTRFVQFKPVDHELRRRYDANVLIDCAFMAHTVPGRPAVEALRQGLEAYARTGFPEEYRLHHQGGAIGYTGRDYKVDFRTEEIVREHQAFAWNPSITGSKSEDTMIATLAGPLILTPPSGFPTIRKEVNGHVFMRPDILVL
jgi:Xaa-Pro aminopeptidase